MGGEAAMEHSSVANAVHRINLNCCIFDLHFKNFKKRSFASSSVHSGAVFLQPFSISADH